MTIRKPIIRRELMEKIHQITKIKHQIHLTCNWPVTQGHFTAVGISDDDDTTLFLDYSMNRVYIRWLHSWRTSMHVMPCPVVVTCWHFCIESYSKLRMVQTSQSRDTVHSADTPSNLLVYVLIILITNILVIHNVLALFYQLWSWERLSVGRPMFAGNRSTKNMCFEIWNVCSVWWYCFFETIIISKKVNESCPQGGEAIEACVWFVVCLRKSFFCFKEF